MAKECAKNFYYAFRTLPSPKRHALYAAYAVCRLLDDIADDEAPNERKREMFERTRADLGAALASAGANESRRAELDPEFVAIRDAKTQYDIPARYFYEILEGVESDLVKTRFANFEELRGYCYKVASAVGLICIEVFGYEDPRAKGYAVDMGVALQLTNILRDLREDAERDRVYIPQDELAEFDYTEDDLKKGVIDDRFRSLMTYQSERARSYYDRSRNLFDLVDPESRTCLRVLHAAYEGILDRIERSGFDVFSRRIGLSGAEKLLIAARLWVGGSLSSARRML